MPMAHYARNIRTRGAHAHYPAARWGHRALPPLRPAIFARNNHTRGVHGALRTAHYPRALPCGAMGTSRPTAITPAITHRKIRTRGAHAIIHAHHPGGAMVGRRVSRLAPYRHYARIFAPPRHRPPGSRPRGGAHPRRTILETIIWKLRRRKPNRPPARTIHSMARYRAPRARYAETMNRVRLRASA